MGDVLKCGGSNDSASSSILDELESSDILGGGINIEGVTIVKFGLYERRSNSECSKVVKCIACTSEVANVDVTRLRK